MVKNLGIFSETPKLAWPPCKLITLEVHSVIGQKTQFHAFVNNKWKGIIIMTTPEFHACHI